MVKRQINSTGWPGLEGGLLCPACSMMHGRSIEAIYPLLFLADHDRESRYVSVAAQLMRWSEQVSCDDGAFANDPTGSQWKLTTVFVVLALADALADYSHLLDDHEQSRWFDRLTKAARFIAEYPLWSTANVNYPIAAAAALQACDRATGQTIYAARSREILEPTLLRFTSPNFFLFGEGTQRLSPRGNPGVDLTYNVEESLPHLARFAHFADDSAIRDIAIRSLQSHLVFMLPDGGWDESWGIRNAKWIYSGSRTTDGCVATLMMLGEHDPRFVVAAYRQVALVDALTHDGLIYAGPHARAAGVQPCLHQTFTRAKDFATALRWPKHAISQPTTPLTREVANGFTSYPEILTSLIARGHWRATIAASDTQDDRIIESSPSGGVISMLWHDRFGPLMTASMSEYFAVEPLNMPRARASTSPLTPRIEMYAEGIRYSQLNDLTVRPVIQDDGAVIEVRFTTYLRDRSGRDVPNDMACFEVVYRFGDDQVTIAVCRQQGSLAAQLTLPIIVARDEMVCRESPQKIRIDKAGGTLWIACEPSTQFRPAMPRFFNPVPGFEAIEIVVEVNASVAVTLQ